MLAASLNKLLNVGCPVLGKALFSATKKVMAHFSFF